MSSRPQPGPGYVHPRAGRNHDHTYGLEVANDASPNYQRWITQLCSPHLGRRVLEIGAGYGAVTRFLRQGVEEYVATDSSPECLAALHDRFRNSANVRVRKLDMLTDDIDGTYDSIILINVLEHLADDAAVLRRLGEHLTPGGRLVIYVPALNALYGDWDDRIGHFRRYSKSHLERVIRAAGLTVVDSRYANLIAIPAWFAFSRLGVRKKQSTSAAGIGRELQIWDRSAVPLTRWFESRWRPPIGLNVLGVAGLRSPLNGSSA